MCVCVCVCVCMCVCVCVCAILCSLCCSFLRYLNDYGMCLVTGVSARENEVKKVTDCTTPTDPPPPP